MIPVIDVRPSCGQDWETACAYNPGLAFFQTEHWLHVLAHAGMGYQDKSLKIAFSDRKEVLLPLMVNTIKLIFPFSEYRSLPFGTYGGPISLDGSPVSPGHLTSILDWLVKQFNSRVNMILYETAIPGETLPAGWKTAEAYTHILDLKDGFEHIWNNCFMSKTRNQCRKARKNGISSRSGDSLDDFRMFYDIYEKNTKIWGYRTPPIPFSIFKNLHNNQDHGVQLMLAEKDGRTVGGMLLLANAKTVFYWLGAFLKEFKNLYPNNLLIEEVLRKCCEKGMRVFNFGASGPLESVKKYKESFGAEIKKYHTLNYYPPAYYWCSRIKRVCGRLMKR